MPSDNDLVRIISRLGVDYSQAIVSTRQFAEEIVKLNTQLKQLLETSASLKRIGQTTKTATQITKEHTKEVQKAAQQYKNLGNQAERSTAKVKAGAKDMKLALVKAEADLRNLLARAEATGVRIQLGPADLGQLRNMQAAVASGRELTKNELSRVETIKKRIALGTQEVRAVENAVRLERERTKLLGTATAFNDREGIAKARSNQLARIELATLRQKLASAEQTITLRKLDEQIVGTSSLTLRKRLATMQEELQTLIRQMEVNKALTTQEMQRLNLLKSQATVMRADVGTAASRASMATFAEKEAKALKAAEEARARRVAEEARQYSVLGSMAERRLSWFLTGATLFGGASALRSAVETLTKVEAGMTQIARITEDASFNFKTMRDNLQSLGVEYGMVWENVSDIATRWAQAGYNVKDTLELTRASLLALNTAELDAQYATQGLIAVMAQWGLTADQLLPVIDKINKTADDFAVSSQDIVDGLNRAGAAAKNAGLSIEETIGAITVLREASGRTGKEVGTALNTILSYMTRTKTINLMESLGIRVFEDEARTTFRSVIELMGELAARWQDTSVSSQAMRGIETELLDEFNEEMASSIGLQKEWNDLQQRDISQAAAGVRRRNFFISLMSRFSKIQEVVNNQLDAEGYSMRENARTMGTLAKQWESLRAAMEQFAVAIGDAGLLNELKQIVTFTTNAVEAFNNLNDTLQTLLLTFAEVTIAIRVLEAILRMAGVGKAVETVGKISIIAKETQTLTKGLTALTALLKNIPKAVVGAFGGPVIAAVIGIVTAAGTVIRLSRESKEAIIEQGTAAEKLVTEYDRLQEKLSNLVEGSQEYQQALSDLNKLQNDIANAIPSAIAGWDSQTQSMIVDRQELERLIEAKENLNKVNEEEGDELKSVISELEKQRKKYEEEAEHFKSQQENLEKLIKKREELRQLLAKQTKGSEEYKRTAEDLARVERFIGNIAQEAGLKRTEAADKIIEKLEELRRVRKREAEETVLLEAQKTQNFINNIHRRLQALDEEIKAYKTLLPGGKYYEYLPFYLKGEWNILPSGEFWTRYKLEKKQEEAAILRDELERSSAELGNILDAIDELQVDEVVTGGGGGGGTAPPPGGQGTVIDAIAKSLERLGEEAEKFTVENERLASSFMQLEVALNSVESRHDYLIYKIETGIGTTADYIQLVELNTERARLLAEQQDRLAQANQNYQQQIDYLKPVLEEATRQYERFKKAGDAEHTKQAASAVSNLQREIDNLTQSISENTRKILENKQELQELTTQAYQQYYESMVSWINHMVAIGRMTTQQQLDFYNSLKKEQLAQREQWEIEEKEYKLRRKRLDEELKAFKEAYEQKKDMIEKEIRANEGLIEARNKEIEALEKQLAMLDEEGELKEREEAERQHNKKIEELLKERHYHELRTGLSHQKAINDINEQVAEEEHRWELQKEEWTRESQKERLQNLIETKRKEIEEIKKAGKEMQSRVENFYQKIADILNDSVLDMIAALPNAYETGLNWIHQFYQGMEDGKEEVPEGLLGFVEDVKSQYRKTLETTVPPPSTIYIPQDTKEGRKQQAHSEAEVARQKLIAAGYSQGASDISSYGYEGAKSWYDKYIQDRTDLSNEVKQEFKKIVEAKKEWAEADKAHTGAYVLRAGLAELEKGERVLSPQMTASFDRLADALGHMPNIPEYMSYMSQSNIRETVIDRAANKIVAAIERNLHVKFDKLINIERADFADNADEESLAREIRAWLVARG